MQPLKVRFVSCAPRNGHENMAIDEYLHSWHLRSRRPFLRIYGWAPPSITLGRYQPAACLNIDSCRENGVSIVRRVTGGGAIYHDREVTYSLACGERDIDGRPLAVGESFELMNKMVIRFYRMMGLPAMFAKELPVSRTPGPRADFCFSGNEEYDIIIEGKKIGGNAQRRSGGTIFQHGSIPLALDADRIRRCFNAAIDFRNFTSIESITGQKHTEDRVIAQLRDAFVISTGWELEDGPLNDEEMAEIRWIMEKKYLTDLWNLEGKAEEHETGKAAMA